MRAKSAEKLGALLRREGIYSSHLNNWRTQLRREGEAGLSLKKPGPKPKLDEKDQLLSTVPVIHLPGCADVNTGTAPPQHRLFTS